jgi:ADP-heptose:LPS heptosyltransferase
MNGGLPAVRRLAIFRALQLGDMLEAIPAMRAIRSGFPNAEITLIGLPWAAILRQRFPAYLDRFVPFAGYPGIVEMEADPERSARFIEEQRAYGYDLVIQMHGSGPISNSFALAIAMRLTAGYYSGEAPPGLTFAAPYPDDQPEALRNLGLARLLDCPDCSPRLEFPLFTEDFVEAGTLLQCVQRSEGPLIGLHAGARPPARRWPAPSFSALADALVRRTGACIVLTGGPGEEGTVQQVAMGMQEPCFNLAGQTTLGGLGALIRSLDLFITNDTGPAHLAYALDVPSITLFGPADYTRWAPLDTGLHAVARHPVPCSPCGFWECPIDHPCLRGISVEQVLSVAEKLLNTAQNSTN